MNLPLKYGHLTTGIAVVIMALFLGGCADEKRDIIIGDLTPKASELYEFYTEPKTIEKVTVNNTVMQFQTATRDSITKYLGLYKARTFIKTKDESGYAEIIGNGATMKRGAYKIVMSYLKYTTEDMIFNGINVGSQIIGVGAIVTIDVNVVGSEFKFTGPLSLGVGAATSAITGSIETNFIGIINDDLTPTIATGIDEASITKAIEAFAVLKPILKAPATTFKPYAIAESRNGNYGKALLDAARKMTAAPIEQIKD